MNQGTRCTEINEIQPETAGSLQSTNWSTSLLGESTNANFLLPGSSTITSCVALGMLFVSCLCELEWTSYQLVHRALGAKLNETFMKKKIF